MSWRHPTAKAFNGDRSKTRFIDATNGMSGTAKPDGSRNPSLEERNPDRSRYNSKIGRILTSLVKFAVDSAVNQSSKGASGLKKLYRIVEERCRHPPASLPLNGCKNPEELKLMEKMQTKIEELREDLTELKQPNVTVPNEGIKKSGVQETEKRRIYIRSRL